MKNLKHTLAIVTVAITITLSLTASNSPEPLQAQPTKDSISQPSLEHKIGQLLIVGFKGYTPSKLIIEAIEKYQIGGVILFDKSLSDKTPSGAYGQRNIKSPKQCTTLIDSLQLIAQKAGMPKLFISIDQEGGLVNRLKSEYGFPKSVSAAYQGKLDDLNKSREYATQTASTLKDIGINIDFAPCTDIAVNPQNPIIAGKERAFSADAEKVTQFNRVWVEELNRGGIISSLKHFPGHGSSVSDSHLGLTDITKTWSDRELEPYRTLISEGYNDIVMIGHLFNSNLDENYPASLSKSTLDILRKEMGYTGVIATDDMNMGAIVNNYSLQNALKLALNAGVDMIVMGNNAAIFEEDLTERTVSIIVDLVNRGEISQKVIERAYQRITKLKQRL